MLQPHSNGSTNRGNPFNVPTASFANVKEGGVDDIADVEPSEYIRKRVRRQVFLTLAS